MSYFLDLSGGEGSKAFVFLEKAFRLQGGRLTLIQLILSGFPSYFYCYLRCRFQLGRVMRRHEGFLWRG